MIRAVLAVMCVLGLSAAPGVMPGAAAGHVRTSGAAADRQGASSTPGPERGMLAILRRDGLLLPFAAFKGNGWSTPWPTGAQGRELPIDLGSIPESWWGGRAPNSWSLYSPDGESRPIRVTAPAVYRSGCTTRLGLRTDYRPSELPPPPGTDPYPKDGLAVTEGMEVIPIPRISTVAPAAADLIKLIGRAFDEAEEKTLRLIRNREGWRHPFTPEERRVQPVKLEAWYRAPMDQPGWSVSYIEASRSYPPRAEDGGCGLDTYFTGWIHHNDRDPGKLRFEIQARVTYCDRAGVLYMLPLGIVHVQNRMYWVFQSSGWDEEWYRVARISPLRIEFVAEFYGGGRRGCPF